MTAYVVLGVGFALGVMVGDWLHGRRHLREIAALKDEIASAEARLEAWQLSAQYDDQ